MNNIRRLVDLELMEILEQFGEEDHRPRQFHVYQNPFDELTRNEFIKIYRLRKERVRQIIDIVQQHRPLPMRRSAVDVQRKVLTALRFFAAGSYQLDVGLGRYSALSQPSVSRCIHDVIDVFNRPEIFSEYIRFYRNIEEVRAARNRFYEKFNFPNAIGCIDCTHVAIVPPPIHHPIHPEYVYVNRKGYHSLNVQLICDADFRILNINARYPGSENDCAIWNRSHVKPLMRRLCHYGNERFYLLGDSGYPLREWLSTPFQRPPAESPEAAYNTCFCRGRSIIECVNGILKMRFRCLLKQRMLHYDPTTAGKITNTCAIFHNMAIEDNYQPAAEIDAIWVDNPDFGLLDEDLGEENIHLGAANPDLAAGRHLRQQIVNQWFPG